MTNNNIVYIELGGNQGNRIALINKAKTTLEKNDCKILNQSSIYETPPWGFNAEQNFYNQVIQIETKKTAYELLEILMDIETKLGRIRNKVRYSSRTIDLDILFFNNEIINDENLIIPHERLHLRNFVLIPLNEIAPQLKHPIFNVTINDLLKSCNDTASCNKLNV